MTTVSEALRKLIDRPDDLSELPKIIEQVETMEGDTYAYQERIKNLQDINKAYLAQIPLSDGKPKEPEPEPELTLEDATAVLVQQFTGGNE